MIQEVETYADLLGALQKLTPEQLAQPVQAIKMHPSWDHVYECCPACAISTIGALEVEYARSSVDNRYNPDEIVLFLDGNMFGKNGVFCYDWHEDGTETPRYLNNKYDPAMDWTGPAQKLRDAQRGEPKQPMSVHTVLSIKNAVREQPHE